MTDQPLGQLLDRYSVRYERFYRSSPTPSTTANACASRSRQPPAESKQEQAGKHSPAIQDLIDLYEDEVNARR